MTRRQLEATPEDYLALLSSMPLDEALTPVALERLKVVILTRLLAEMEKEAEARGLNGRERHDLAPVEASS